MSDRAIRKYLMLCFGIVLIGATGFYINRLTLLGAAFNAKTICSSVFISGRAIDEVERDDVRIGQHPVLQIIQSRVDLKNRKVTAGLFGLAQRTAVFRDGLGCTIIFDTEVNVSDTPFGSYTKRPSPTQNRHWPDGDVVVPASTSGEAANENKMRAVFEEAFTEPDEIRRRRTRALLVAHNGQIIYEHYAPGFSQTTPLLGWSMTKTVTGALIGILVQQNKLSLYAPAPVPEWVKVSDPRHTITLDNLLHMNSGLAFSEIYGDPGSDVVRMLFSTPDMAAYAAAKPLVAAPGTVWHYSTGTSNILSRIVRQNSGHSPGEWQSFPRRALLDRIGMTSAVLEPDASGTFSGSSYLYATARDWARFGLLYMNDGMWNGERILPKGWVDYSRTPPTPTNTDYGAHLWRRVPEPYFKQGSERIALPADTMHMVGFQAQFVTVIPSRKLVIVRLGLSDPWSWDHEGFVARVLRTLPE